jgi:hypothetical protein
VRIRWLMGFMVARFKAAPEDLHMQLPSRPGGMIIRGVEAEAAVLPRSNHYRGPFVAPRRTALARKLDASERGLQRP